MVGDVLRLLRREAILQHSISVKFRPLEPASEESHPLHLQLERIKVLIELLGRDVLQEVLELGALEGMVEVMAVSENATIDLGGVLTGLRSIIFKEGDLIEVAEHSQFAQEGRILNVDHADVTLTLVSLLL